MVGGMGPLGGGSRGSGESHPWTQEREAPEVAPWVREGGPYLIRYRAVTGYDTAGERVLHVVLEYRLGRGEGYTRVGLAACGAKYDVMPGSVSFEAGPWHRVCQAIARREQAG